MSFSHRILVVRNDKLGDFMLAWPALKALRHASPDNHIAVLVPDYTAPMARLCPWIDEVLIDPGAGSGSQLTTLMRDGHFDALLTLFSTPRVGWAGMRAHIPLRMAPATKWAQFFYGTRITQRRSRSLKPEYIYNLELAEALAKRLNQYPRRVAPPYWPLESEQRASQRQQLAHELALDSERQWWVLHPGSGGSAVNLSPQRYIELAEKVTRHASSAISFIVSWGPGEKERASAVTQALAERQIDAHLMPARAGLAEFALTLAAADGMIAGSTGPLHIAGCLDIATLGFFPAKRSATSLRWQTCNDSDKRLAFSPPPSEDARQATNMERIDIDAAAIALAKLIDKR
ncbi:glycosyltransferase family 9 protein [Carnimonas bestiolae]|uniref:glycosyltransferase family 9 protein n=1 Tax=Carnimonas bestiolae TaxID=3402172 RepID=UPI003EDB8FDB